MEFEFTKALVARVAGYVYTIVPRQNCWKVQFRKVGGTTCETDENYKTLNSAQDHVRTLAKLADEEIQNYTSDNRTLQDIKE